MELKSAIPEGWAVLDVLVIAKTMDEEGNTALYQGCSDGLRTWEAAGMALALLDSLRGGLRDMFEPDDEG